MKTLIVFLCFLLSAAALHAIGPTISNVTWSQPNGAGKVTISYTVSEAAVVTVDILTNGVSIGSANLMDFREAGLPAAAGSAFNRVVLADTHTVVWNPYRILPNAVFTNGEVDVKLTAYSLKRPPDYMLVDLTGTNNVHYYASTNDLPFGPLVMSNPYRTTHFLMRRIPAAGVRWRMGAASLTMPSDVQAPSYCDHETPHFVTLTNDYYMGVFEVTQRQHELVTGTNPSEFSDPTTYPEHYTMPVENVSVRGLSGTADWRRCGDAVANGSPLDRWRKRTMLNLDLPTEARWEFACRAGSTNSFHNGTDDANGVGRLGWTQKTSDVDGHTHPVGGKEPNAFGLYDTHGNVFEFVVDEWNATVLSNPVLDPDGYLSGTSGFKVTLKGGAFNYDTAAASAAAGRSANNGGSGSQWGYRLWAPLPEVK